MAKRKKYIIEKIATNPKEIIKNQKKLIADGNIIAEIYSIFLFPFIFFLTISVFNSNFHFLVKTILFLFFILNILWVIFQLKKPNEKNNYNNAPYKPQQIELIIVGLALIVAFPLIIYATENRIEKILSVFTFIFVCFFYFIYIKISINPHLILNRNWTNLGTIIVTTLATLLSAGFFCHLLTFKYFVVCSLIVTVLILIVTNFLSKNRIHLMHFIIIGSIPANRIVSSIKSMLQNKVDKKKGEQLANEILKNNDIGTIISVIKKLDYELNGIQTNSPLGQLTKYLVPFFTFFIAILSNYFWSLYEPIIQKSTPKLEIKIKEIKDSFFNDKDTINKN